jgi:hypothetical protein
MPDTEPADNLWQLYREMEAKLQRREDEIKRLEAHYENHQALIEDYSRMWRNQCDTITRAKWLAPRLRRHAGRPDLVAEIADELEKAATETQGLKQVEPDWADIREAARNAGWTRDRGESGTTWGHHAFGAILDRSHGMAYVNSGNRRIYIASPGGDERQTVVLFDPTPVRVLTAAKLVGLVGLGDGDA